MYVSRLSVSASVARLHCSFLAFCCRLAAPIVVSYWVLDLEVGSATIMVDLERDDSLNQKMLINCTQLRVRTEVDLFPLRDPGIYINQTAFRCAFNLADVRKNVGSVQARTTLLEVAYPGVESASGRMLVQDSCNVGFLALRVEQPSYPSITYLECDLLSRSGRLQLSEPVQQSSINFALDSSSSQVATQGNNSLFYNFMISCGLRDSLGMSSIGTFNEDILTDTNGWNNTMQTVPLNITVDGKGYYE